MTKWCCNHEYLSYRCSSFSENNQFVYETYFQYEEQFHIYHTPRTELHKVGPHYLKLALIVLSFIVDGLLQPFGRNLFDCICIHFQVVLRFFLNSPTTNYVFFNMVIDCQFLFLDCFPKLVGSCEIQREIADETRMQPNQRFRRYLNVSRELT